MIRPLRRRHRVMWTALAVLLPVAVLGAIAGRQTPPSTGEALVFPGEPGPQQRLDLGGGWAIELSEAPGVPPRLAVRLSPALERPTVLLYWSPVAPAGGALPDRARLLGPLSAEHVRAVPKPPGEGFLLLYSLLDGSLLGSAELPAAGG